MHVSKAFQLMKEQSEIDVLSGFTVDVANELRENIVNMVLGTDMSFHFEDISHFQAQVMAPNADMNELAVRRKVMRMCLHCADVSNPAKSFVIYEKFANLVMEEFYEQGDQERKLGKKRRRFLLSLFVVAPTFTHLVSLTTVGVDVVGVVRFTNFTLL